MRQTKRRLSKPAEDSQPRKKIHRRRGSPTPLPPVVLGPSDPSGAHTPGGTSPPVRARIFRDGKCYIPPDLLQPATAPLLDPATSPGPSVEHAFQPDRVMALDWPHADETPPIQRPSLEEAWHLNFPHTRLLTDIQAVNRRVRLLLPEDGSIVDPSSNPHTRPTSTPAISAVPDPDPSTWASQYPQSTQLEPLGAYHNARASAEYYRSWLHAPPTVEEALEHLTAARLEVWRDAHSQLARLQAVEKQLLCLRRSLAAVATNTQETS